MQDWLFLITQDMFFSTLCFAILCHRAVAQFETQVFGIKPTPRPGDSVIDLKNSPSSLSDLVNRETKIQVSSSSSPSQPQMGGFIFGPNNHTLVLFEGIPLNDDTSVAGTFDFSSLTSEIAKKIWIKPGVSTSIFGTGALSGEIELKHIPAPQNQLALSGGSFGYQAQKIEISSDPRSSLLVKNESSAGPSHTHSPEQDAFKRKTFFHKLQIPSESSLVTVFFLSSESFSEYDSGSMPPTDDLDAYSEQSSQILSGSFETSQQNQYRLDFKRSNRLQRDAPNSPSDALAFSGEYESFWMRALFHSSKSITPTTKLQLGFSAQQTQTRFIESSLFQSNSFAKTTPGTSQFLLLNFKSSSLTWEPSVKNECLGERCRQALNLRMDAKIPQLDTWFQVSKGFKFATSYQKHSLYGDPFLDAETVQSFITGAAFKGDEEKSKLTATAFKMNYENLVDYNFNSNKFYNFGRVQAYGISLDALRDFSRFQIGQSISYIEIFDQISNQHLLRKPKWKLSSFFQQTFLSTWDLKVCFNFLGSRQDQAASSQRVDLPPSSLWELSLAKNISQEQKIDFHIFNVFNDRSEQIYGYKSDAQKIELTFSSTF